MAFGNQIHRSLRTSIVLLLAACSASAWAETTYACKTEGGTAYRSRQPCPRLPTPGMVYYGPARQAPKPYERPVQRIERAGEEQAYMSARCVTMQDGIRTAPNRGLSYETVREMQQNFEQECSDERWKAMRQLRKDQRSKEKQAEEQQELAQQRRFESQEAETRFRNQCAEMRMSIHRRKQRPNPTEGDLRDLALFEERYTTRCL